MNATEAVLATTPKQRLAGLLLLVGTGTVGTLAYVLISGGGTPATPVAENPPSGTGVVIGASPSAAPRLPVSPPVQGVFLISGGVDGLVPGTAKTMPLTVTNPNSYAIQVLTVDTGVAVPTATSCPSGSLAVGDYTFDDGDAVLTAPPGGTVRVDVPVELRDSLTQDQTGCRAATFALTFEGTAREVAS